MQHDTMSVLFVGLVAGILSIVAFTPHVWTVYNSNKKVVKTSELWTYFVYALSLLIWGIYGSLRGDIPLILTCFLQLIVVILVFICIVCAQPTLQQDLGQHEMETEVILRPDELNVKDDMLP